VRDEFEAEWDEWLDKLQSFRWASWDTGLLWKLTKLHRRRVRDNTVHFVESWIEGLRSGDDTKSLDDLVTRQERFNKKGRARLNPTAEESIGEWIGIADLNYRLNVARTIINDIHVALAQPEGDDA